MKRLANIIATIAILFLVLGSSGSFYIVDETQQSVITQFGEPLGQPITQAGLYFKTPFIQTVNYFDKRILRWDGEPNQIPTLEKRYIWVDTTARWRIVDALKFMRTVGTLSNAYARLDDIVDAAARDVVSNHKLIETLRTSNRLLEVKRLTGDEEADIDVGDVAPEKIKSGREVLTREILERSAATMAKFGIELVDVRIKRLNYVQDVRKKVYERMVSERRKAAEKFRSEGQGKKAEIEGQVLKELQEIQSEAYRKAQEIKGKADAEAIKIYAESYNQDPEFYAFLKTLDTYRNTINAGTTLMLDVESDYYRYLKSIDDKPSPRRNIVSPPAPSLP